MDKINEILNDCRCLLTWLRVLADHKEKIHCTKCIKMLDNLQEEFNLEKNNRMI